MSRKLSQRRLQLAVDKLKPKLEPAPKPTLKVLPVEILHEICIILALEDKSSCSCLSRSSKLMYRIATPCVYRYITTEGLRSVRGEKLSALFHTMVNTRGLASLVTEIDFLSYPQEIIPFDGFRYFRAFKEVAHRICNRAPWTCQTEFKEWMAPLIAISAPCLRSLQYRLTGADDYAVWATLLTTARETYLKLVQFPYLRKLAIGSTGRNVLDADWLLQLLFDTAPNIQELTLDGLFKVPSPNKQFRHIRILQLSDQILFAERDLKNLIECCPELRSFALTYTRFKGKEQRVNPQRVVNMLKPVAGQLTELRLRPSGMTLRGWFPLSERPENLSLSFKSLKALKVLEIDAACCWRPLYSPHDTLVIPLWGKAGCLAERLPAGLKELTFAAIDEQLGTVISERDPIVNQEDGYEIDEYDREHSIDGLVRFARRVKQHCPLLQCVKYGFNPKFDACLGRELLKLQHVFAEEGISFSSESLYPNLCAKIDTEHWAVKAMRNIGL